ncbi:MAG: hypothetical protein RSB71_01740 [Bacilli bacterium]
MEEVLNDAQLLKKLKKDKKYREKLIITIKACKTLNIKDEATFIAYQIQMKQLQEFHYNEITLLERLHDKEYSNKVKQYCDFLDIDIIDNVIYLGKKTSK